MSFWQKEKEEKIDALTQLENELEAEINEEIPESAVELSLEEKLALEAEEEIRREKQEAETEAEHSADASESQGGTEEISSEAVSENTLEVVSEAATEELADAFTEDAPEAIEEAPAEAVEEAPAEAVAEAFAEQVSETAPESELASEPETNSESESKKNITACLTNMRCRIKDTFCRISEKVKKIRFKWKHLAGIGVLVAGVILIVWGISHYQSVSSDVNETESTEPANEMAVISISYTPEVRLSNGEKPETEHLSYQTMRDNLRGWICEFGRINIRDKADFEGEVIDYVVYGDQVNVYEQEGEFTRIKYISPISGEVLEGYCYTEYISDTEPEGPQVYLNVPLYKQADHRWGAVKIGSYETLASAGCTTTCISMVESYMTGQDVFPDDVVEMLYYTYDGRLVFPDYYFHHWARDYMTVAVRKLHEGIPVLVSGYNAAGGTHWVVLVAYKGDGEDFSSDLFLINDPGSPRATLTDFMRDYPFIEKIVYYNK